MNVTGVTNFPPVGDRGWPFPPEVEEVVGPWEAIHLLDRWKNDPVENTTKTWDLFSLDDKIGATLAWTRRTGPDEWETGSYRRVGWTVGHAVSLVMKTLKEELK